MPHSVNDAFNSYLNNAVNLNPTVVSAARQSRDNLLSNIAEFNNDRGFFELCSEYNVHFGSFSRKTKCRPLDDIDLMICIAANNAKIQNSFIWNQVTIKTSPTSAAQIACQNTDGTLNSTKVLNLFKTKITNLRSYARSDIHRDGEALRVNLTSREWAFDIVPCFVNTDENLYYVPNGQGNWMKTNPKLDAEHIHRANSDRPGLLNLIRLCKKWNRVSHANIPSYLLENIIINYAYNTNGLASEIKYSFLGALDYIRNHLYGPVQDPKRIQGNLNTLSLTTGLSIQRTLNMAIENARQAILKERIGSVTAALICWEKVFGEEFPVQ